MKKILIMLPAIALIACSNQPTRDKIFDIDANRTAVFGSMNNAIATFTLDSKLNGKNGIQQSNIQIHIEKFPIVYEFDLCRGAEDSYVAQGYIVALPFTCPSFVRMNATDNGQFIDGSPVIVNFEFSITLLQHIRITERGQEKFVSPVIDIAAGGVSTVPIHPEPMDANVTANLTSASDPNGSHHVANIILRTTSQK